MWTLQYQTERCVYDLDALLSTSILDAKRQGLPVKLGLEVDYVGRAAGAARPSCSPATRGTSCSARCTGSTASRSTRSRASGRCTRSRTSGARTSRRSRSSRASGSSTCSRTPTCAKIFGSGPSRPCSPSCTCSSPTRRRDAGVAVEISTAGLRKPVGELYPDPALLRACVARGVPITTASDAHVPVDVGRDFDRALALARGGRVRDCHRVRGPSAHGRSRLADDLRVGTRRRRARVRGRRPARARRRSLRPSARARRPFRRRRDRARAHRRRARRRRARRHRLAVPVRRRDAGRASTRCELLAEAYRQVRAAGFELVNADAILIGEEPRIAPRREEMRERLAGALGVEPDARQRPRDDDRPPRLHRPRRGARGRRRSRYSGSGLGRPGRRRGRRACERLHGDRSSSATRARRLPRRAAASVSAAAGTSPRTGPACAPARTAARATGMSAASGQTPQRGTRARQTVAPRSISAWAHSPSKTPPLRSRTRRTFVSSGTTSRPSAKHSIASAVYGPTPGSSREIVRPAAHGDDLRGPVQVDGAAVVAEPLPGDDHLGARLAAASASAVGQRSSQARYRGTTRGTCVCCSITSETRIAYGIARPPPGQVAPVRLVPALERGLHPGSVERMSVHEPGLPRATAGLGARPGLLVLHHGRGADEGDLLVARRRARPAAAAPRRHASRAADAARLARPSLVRRAARRLPGSGDVLRRPTESWLRSTTSNGSARGRRRRRPSSAGSRWGR